MGFSRGLANVATFGAIGRVDKAKEFYSALYEEYRSIISSLEKIREYSRRIVEADKTWSHFRKHNDHILESLNRDKGISEETKQALKLLETDLEPSALAENFLHSDLGDECTIREDSTENNLAAFAATSIMNIIPFAGTIAAHLAASDEIREIGKESDKIIREIDRIMPTFKQAVAQCNKLRLRNEAFRHIKEVLEKNGLPCSSLPYVEVQPPEVTAGGNAAMFYMIIRNMFLSKTGGVGETDGIKEATVGIKEKPSNGSYGVVNCLYSDE